MKALEDIKREVIDHLAETREWAISYSDVHDAIDHLHSQGLLMVWNTDMDSAPMCEDVDLWTQYGRYVRCQHDDYGNWFIWSDEYQQYVTLAPAIKPTAWMPLPKGGE